MLRISTIKNWKRLIGNLRSRKEIYPVFGYRFLFREVVSKRWHNLLLYFTVLLYFLLAMLLFPHAFGNKLLYSNYIGL